MSHRHLFPMAHIILPRLELKRKELIAQKDQLLKESKAKQATFDNVKTQVDKLMKVCMFGDA